MTRKAALSVFAFLVFFQGYAQVIKNAGFEKGNTSDWLFTNPAYYKLAKDSGFTYTIVREAKEGKFSAKLTNTGQGVWCQLRQKVAYQPTGNLEKIRMSAYVKTKDIHNGEASLSIRPVRRGKSLSPVDGIKIDSSRGWTKLYVDVVVPSDTDSLLLFCSMDGDGTAWFDDIHLEKSPEPIRQLAAAKQYLDTALAIISRTALYKDSVDLNSLMADAQLICADAKSTADCYAAISYVLQGLGDRHSSLLTPKQVKQVTGSNNTTMELPSGKLINGNIGCVKVPPVRTLNNDTLIKAYASKMQQVIRSLDSKRTIGWIVDDRNNTGGNSLAMMLGLGPIIGNGISERTINNGIVMDSSGYWDGEWRSSDGYSIKIDAPYTLVRPYPAVAVLTNGMVGSSGESVVLNFKYRPKTIIMGEPTYGLTTGNADFELSDGAIMLVTASVGRDRLGNKYGGKIYPDVTVKDDDTTANDEVIDAAVKWLKEKAVK